MVQWMDMKVDIVTQVLTMKIKNNSIFFYEKIRQFVRVIKIGKKKIKVVGANGEIFKIKKDK